MSYRPQLKTSGGMIDFPLDAETVKGKTILEQTYPVGSIYLSVDSTSPASLFGGTWTQIKDTFLLGAGDTYTAGDTGGNATHSHTSGSLVSCFDLLNGRIYSNRKSATWNNNKETNGLGITETTSSYSMDNGVSITGSTDSSNNMPPYLTVYMWKRTA